MVGIPTIRTFAVPQTLGERLSLALAREPTIADADQWEVIEGAISLIAEHYGLCRDDVWIAVIELEDELARETGHDNFGRALEAPWGFTALGMRVVDRLLGPEEAQRLAPLHLSFH